MELPKRIKRFGPPNNFDLYPYGTICELGDGTLYRQISRDEDNPIWDKVTDDIIENL